METFNLDLNSTPSPVDTSLASASFSPSTSDGHSNNYEYDVFINHHDDVKKTIASHLYHNLISHGLRVFLETEESHRGDGITSQIDGAIPKACIHMTIFSKTYPKSVKCLNELLFVLESRSTSGSTIVPVFYHVYPSELRTSNPNGWYTEALRSLENEKIFDSRTRQKNPRYDRETIGKWRNALSEVADINGFVLKDCNGDEGKMVNNIVERVLKKLKNHRYYDVFINHRGPDVKKNLASHLYYSLTAHGLRVFLDIEEMQQGDGLNSQIERSIQKAFVHIAIFSPGYAESKWCLEELVLMLKSGKTIIPILYGVQPSELRSENGKYAQDLCMLKGKKALDTQTKQEKQRFDNETVEKWRSSLSHVAKVAERSGFDLEECDGDEGQLVDQVVKQVLLEEVKILEEVKQVCQQHRRCRSKKRV